MDYLNSSGLPKGSGSMQIRGNVYWIIYRDAEGRIIQENTRTNDENEARRLLAQSALSAARARVAALERIARGEKTPHRKSDSEGHPRSGAQQQAGSRSLRQDPARSTQRAKTRKGATK